MSTSEDLIYEEQECCYYIQDTDFIYLSHFDLLKWLIKIIYYPLLIIFTILWYQCGPGYHLIGRVLVIEVWGKAPSIVTITQLWFLLVKHPILWWIYLKYISIIKNKGGYMDGDGCGSNGVWNFPPETSLQNVVISVSKWYFLRVGLCAMEDCYYDVLDWYLDQFEDL